jgi:serine/threonine protein phosphatase PrpC
MDTALADGTTCRACGEPVSPGERYCESCGAELPSAAAVGAPPVGPAGDRPAGGGAPSPAAVVTACPELGAAPASCPACSGRVAEDGYCEVCGTPAVRPRDHWVEQPVSWVAAVCDRGVRHHRNEDAVALAGTRDGTPGSGRLAVLVVCDGVSSSADSDVASLAAARSARDVLAAGEPAGGQPGPGQPATPDSAAPDSAAPDSAAPDSAPPDSAAADSAGPDAGTPDRTRVGTDRARALTGRIRRAAEAADAQVRASAGSPPSSNPPACTFAAAVVEDRLLVAGWVGDSRVYWLADDGPAGQLSVDDSWASEQIALGMTREEAEQAPQAHEITRWLGLDSPDAVPRTASTALTAAGWVLVCSDGLWNYCSPAAGLRDLVREIVAGVGADPATVARELVTWANRQGGHDNITVALARIG